MDSDRDLFLDKLSQAKYSYSEIYDNYVYNVVKMEKYRVTDNFPRFRHNDLPRGIVKVKYERFPLTHQHPQRMVVCTVHTGIMSVHAASTNKNNLNSIRRAILKTSKRNIPSVRL